MRGTLGARNGELRSETNRLFLPPPLSRRLCPLPRRRALSARGVDVVSLNVTAVDTSNHYVTDLDEKDFSVFEDGVKQDLSFFTRKQQSIAMSLLLDSSASMEDKLPTLQTAATNFVKRLKSNDLAQVIDFDSRVEIRQAFTVEPERAAVRHPADDGGRLDVAVQRHLHLAQGAGEDRRPVAKKTSAARRSCCSPTARTRRA